MYDIYFEERFGQLYEQIEGGSSEVFHFENEHGKIQHGFIKRPLDQWEYGTGYYDLITPYGYGGPLVTEVKGDKGILISDFGTAFRDYCQKQQIVSEFVRFHPILRNAYDFKDMYRSEYCRQTIGTLISQDTMQKEFSASTRKRIRKSLREGASITTRLAPDQLDSFRALYYQVMQEKQASDFYFFDQSYFERLIEQYQEHLLVTEVWYQGELVGSELNFVWDDLMQAHLSASKKQYDEIAPSCLLCYGSVEWAEKHGVRVLHHGGGLTNDPQDSLLRFKRRFTKENEYEFYVGKIIYNQPMYEQLTRSHTKACSTDFFPAYRSEM